MNIEYLAELTNAFAIPLIILGLVQCFFGLNLLKIWCGISGFVVGGGIAVTIMGRLTENLFAVGLIGFMIGLICAYCAYRVYRLGLAIYGFSLGIVIGSVLKQGELESILIGVALGIIILFCSETIIIVMTSIQGAINLSAGLAMILIIENTMIVVLGGVLFISGTLIQLRINNKTIKQPRDHKNSLEVKRVHKASSDAYFMHSFNF